ncbi:alcohol dehydrogenase [Aaosphaeria arxii CBS 175.79]|uniref:Alcohol dehydrogenase n=1 Tax=Aaosphaeria arxii CBS 175.79 TaxID=1450172 RepID=A0A6A5XAY7_9PLEO|nr:alcohol dehydrogenase [Aaosphaeria arxii CBS 175.79]KAF2009947.1 alcohol dehydrogenase [Aaosphaeria arxii CBS 175.79]
MAPTTTRQWTVEGQNGFDSLKFNEKAEIKALGDHDVLVKIHAASLNYRDLIIPKGKYPFPIVDNVVPGSDGAGTVEAVGPRVTRFKPGDKVVTLFSQGHQAGSLDNASLATGLGGAVDGTFREYGAFEETGLVHQPKNLNALEASTLSCAALTAWNALYGLESKALKQGEVVLTQGTGGVSIFAVQFAKAAGATVIATTSSAEKAKVLKKHGADYVINYKDTPNWGEEAKKLTPGGVGVNHVVEVGGPTTMAQSIKAAKIDGVISIIGFIGGFGKDQPTFLDCLTNLLTVRGLLVGSRAQFEDMNRAIEANDIHPVIDEKVFDLASLKEAYQYMWDQNHFGKLTLRIAAE